MARIRTIKPEFWTDERLTECSLSARLMLIGMLNFADDNGNQPYSAKRLKMQIFPADAIDTQPLLDELLKQGLVIEYSVSDEKFLHIKGFRKHQVINRPSATKIPQPPFIEDSVSPPPQVTDGEEGKGEEVEVSKDTLSPKAPASPSVQSIPNCPHTEILELFGKHLPMLPQPRPEMWDGAKADALRARWRWVLTAKRKTGEPYASNSAEALDWFDRFFTTVSESDFLTGRNGKWSSCDLGWLMKADNFAKVVQGNYINR
jgi:hypothetical protein